MKPTIKIISGKKKFIITIPDYIEADELRDFKEKLEKAMKGTKKFIIISGVEIHEL
jgi:anti-anti-sigma regulatory factor